MATANAATVTSGVDQLADLIARVDESNAGDPTPCAEWTVSQLVDHIVRSLENFAVMVRGDEVDWAAPTAELGAGRAAAFDSAARALTAAWSGSISDGSGGSAGMQCAELSVHTWDLATALGVGTDALDPQIAEAGSDFMRENLTDGMRGDAFGPATEAPEGADAYTRIAAFAGRTV